MRLQCKVVTYTKPLTVHFKMFEALIAHLEVCVLCLEETSSRSFLLLSKEIGRTFHCPTYSWRIPGGVLVES